MTNVTTTTTTTTFDVTSDATTATTTVKQALSDVKLNCVKVKQKQLVNHKYIPLGRQ